MRRERVTMPHLFDYHIFISHAWKHSDDYNRLVTTLRNSLYFTFHDYSINADKSLTSKRVPDYQIRQSLADQIKQASVVLVLLGMYASYHEWIQTEVDIAVSLGKPVIGIKPWGQERLPQEIVSKCNKIVGWNGPSIIDSIRECVK